MVLAKGEVYLFISKQCVLVLMNNNNNNNNNGYF